MENGLTFPQERSKFSFRDGERLVPEHLAPWLGRLETHRMTYEEAVQTANRLMESEFLNAQSDRFVSAHFRGIS